MKRRAVAGRADWRRLLSEQGCTWHDDGKDGCWREDVVWELTQGETDILMRSAAEVLSLYQQAADHVVRRGLWNRLGFETEEAAIIQASLERRDEATLGRFDFLMDESGQPRLLEFNADNALSLVESAVLQREWLREVLPGKEQCNVLHARLVEQWKKRGVSRVHVAWRPRHAEVEGTARYMAAVVREAGLDAQLTALHSIGWHRGRAAFIDGAGRDVECCWKVYPWEWMLREPFAEHLATARCQFVEPAWRLLFGNKGMLSLLWELFGDHPALLSCQDEPRSSG